MTNRLIRVGAGNKTFDRFNLAFFGVIIILFATLSFVNISWVYFPGIFSLISAVHAILMTRRYYIYMIDDNIIVDHVFKKQFVIDKSLYKEISLSLFSIPFSNELIIHFKNGKSFRFQGGTSRIAELHSMIANVDAEDIRKELSK
jgi:hypothetical protein